MYNILIVDDEKKILNIMSEYLKKEGFGCYIADNGIDALKIIKDEHIDIVILDVVMPEFDGFTICELIKKNNDIPIIFLTSKDKEEDKLRGYGLGADDYVTKPFSPRVIVAKVKVLLKRSKKINDDVNDYIKVGNIYLYPNQEKVLCSEEIVELTHIEFKLLYFLMKNQNQVFSREQLLNQVWGYDYLGNSRTVDTHIRRLRRKLKNDGKYIVTLIRSGYKFEV